MKDWQFWALLALTTLLTGCSDSRWEGYVYPNRDDLAKHISIGEFDSLEACRAAATSRLRSMNWDESGDYECGKNCRADDYGQRICEATER